MHGATLQNLKDKLPTRILLIKVEFTKVKSKKRMIIT
jgi:hypothetical protein